MLNRKTLVSSHRTRAAAVISVIAVLGLLLTSCMSGTGTGDSQDSNQPISFRLYGGDWDTLNPTKAVNFGAENMVFNLYDRLIAYGENGEFLPQLAESWKVTPTVATFKLKEGPTCTDGTPVTPSVVKNSLDYLADPKTGSSQVGRIFGSVDPLPVITADDSTSTLTVEVGKPNTSLLAGLGSVWASIICPAGLANPDKLSSKAFGSGPFVLGTSTRGSTYEMTPRKGYDWGVNGYKSTDFPSKRVEAKVVESETTAANLLAQGALTIASVNGSDSVRTEKIPGIYSVKTSIPGSDILAMNQVSDRPGASVAVRKAVFSIVNSEAMNQAATQGLATLSNTIMSPSTLACYREEDGKSATKFDPAEAQKELENDGWQKVSGKWMKNGQPLSIHIVTTSGYGSVADYLQATLADFGIEATATDSDINAYINTVFSTGDWDLTYYPLPGAFPTPQNLASQLQGSAPPDGNNFAHITNNEFDRLTTLARQTEGAKGCEYWQEAERALLSRPDVKPIALQDINWFGNGVSFSAVGGGLLDLTTIKTG